MKHSGRLVIVKLFFLFMTFFLASVAVVAAYTLNVGPGETYTTIQAAVDGAGCGDTIIVKDGTYNENVLVDKALIIRSENGNINTFVVAADIEDDVFHIMSNNVTIDGFTVYGASASDMAGIRLIDFNNCTVSNNRCGYESGKNNYFGILCSPATSCIVNNNECSENINTGIIVDGNDNQISYNECVLNNISGILVSGERNCIEYNDCSENGDGIGLLGSNSIVKMNCCNDNQYSGIYGNHIDSYTICFNYCESNLNNGINLNNGANGNLIILNDFISNYYNVSSSSSTNNWQSPVKIWYQYNDPGGTLDPPYVRSYMGNYYSDHVSVDEIPIDGICDSVYVLPDTVSDDEFPLFENTAEYVFSIDCDWDAEVLSGEDLLVLGNLTIGSGGSGSLMIAGSLMLGSI